tara:strand:+ start:67033 stop:68493 length:1461 start_codon:yes stop_codon:yes gene_type:complete
MRKQLIVLLMSLLSFNSFSNDLSSSIRPKARPSESSDSIEAVRLPKKIKITKQTTFREASFFADTVNLIGMLNEGDEAEVLSINTNHASGVGLQVRLTSGPRKGQVGWVYYHTDPKSLRLDLFDQNGEEINVNDFDGLSVGEKKNAFNLYFESVQKKMVAQGDGKTTYPNVPEHLSRILPNKEIWNRVKKGNMKLDINQYKGGEYFPFVESVVDNNGYETKTTYWAQKDESFFAEIPSTIKEVIEREYRNCDDGGAVPENESLPEVEGNWVPGCQILARSDLADHHYEATATCLDNIKATILEGAGSGNNLSQDVIFRNAYSKLNSKEQEFFAMTNTAMGEAGILAPPLEEMVMIMKVLSNRKDYAQSRGYHEANELDAALQSWQFSMYNRNDPNWKRAVRSNSSNPQTRNAIKAYLLYQNTDYGNSDRIDEIYHYHTNYVSPAWKENSKIVKPQLNGRGLKQSGTRHIFYRNIPWSFRNNKWSGK